jgi:hypothetical protein
VKSIHGDEDKNDEWGEWDHGCASQSISLESCGMLLQHAGRGKAYVQALQQVLTAEAK